MAAGLSLKGAQWTRAQDTVGMAVVVNSLSHPASDYFAAGGMGILIGDGRLNYAPERAFEAYDAAALTKRVAVTFDFQRLANPAYNRDRGPVSIYGLRLHADF